MVFTSAARLRSWIESTRELAGRRPKRYPTLEDAFHRMQETNPHLAPARARHLTVHGSGQNEDGTFSWKFDNYVRLWPPYDMPQTDVEALWRQITSPSLLIYGKESWASDPRTDGRAAHFKNATIVSVDGAGHWVQHDKLDTFLGLVEPFIQGKPVPQLPGVS